MLEKQGKFCTKIFNFVVVVVDEVTGTIAHIPIDTAAAATATAYV